MKEISNSYGIIAYRNNKCLLVTRRNTYSYTSFIRGKYKRNELYRLFQEMTETERNKLIVGDFDKMWKDVTHKLFLNNQHMKRNYIKCKNKFETTKTEYDDFALMLSMIESVRIMPECNFPKGKKKGESRTILGLQSNINKIEIEYDFECAIREFEEETKISRKYLTFIHKEPLYEYFIGDDRKLYKYNYYIAIVSKGIEPFLDPSDYNQTFEISNIFWEEMYNIKTKLGKQTSFRDALFSKLNNIIKKFNYDLMDKSIKKVFVKKIVNINNELYKKINNFR
jgi:hypothetical protein